MPGSYLLRRQLNQPAVHNTTFFIYFYPCAKISCRSCQWPLSQEKYEGRSSAQSILLGSGVNEESFQRLDLQSCRHPVTSNKRVKAQHTVCRRCREQLWPLETFPLFQGHKINVKSGSRILERRNKTLVVMGKVLQQNR